MKNLSPGCFHISLPGGIGNQLFALFASRYIAQQTGLQNHLDFSSVDYSHTKATYDIRSFKLQNDELVNCQKRSRLNYIDSSLIRVMNKLSTDIKYRDNFAGLLRFPLNYDRKNNIDAAIRNNFFSSAGPLIPRIFDSYLGDFAFYDEICKKNGKRLILLNSSKRFNSYYNLIRQQSTLGVHLRLGDFLQHKSSVGCLSDSYFSHSINRLTSFAKYDQVLVFSDSVELATERIAGWELDIPIELVSVKEDADPAEDLILLSLCTGIVCSNSTFSFWAAKLASLNGRDELAVVIPEEFRRDGQTCVSSIPKTWLLEPSRWD